MPHPEPGEGAQPNAAKAGAPMASHVSRRRKYASVAAATCLSKYM